MMRDAEKGKFQAVVAWKSNRIGRNMLQAMVNEAKLDDCGVRCFMPRRILTILPPGVSR